MARPDTLWPLEPGTAAKHRLYKRYLDAWWPIMLQPPRSGRPWPRVTYVDAFAGPGRYEGGEEGSPIFALTRLLGHDAAERMRLSRDRVNLLYLEKRRDRYECLLGELARHFGDLDALPVRVIPRRSEAAVAGELLTEIGAWGSPVLGVFDSWGNVNVPLTLIAKLAQNPASEVIVTFGPNWFNRRENLNPDQLDTVFGGREYWVPADRESRADERWRAWLASYRDALRRAGFRFQLQFEIVPKTGQPLYLVYGTNHPRGVEAMKAAMWDVDGNDGIGFRDPRTRGAPSVGQLNLWADIAQPELLELVTQRLQTGVVTLEQLREWLLVETARWRAKDARQAVGELLREGLVSVSPPGRLTRSSTIMLR